MLPDRIFFTGVPGSGWSVISQIIEAIPGMNTTDRHTSRQYTHESGATHVGAYFGENMEYPLDLGVKNLDSPWMDDGGCRLIKSHDWAFCLDEIKYRYPTAWILLIYRNTELSLTHWIDAGGFDFWLANVSCPFMYDGVRYVPKIKEVAEIAKSFGIDVSIAIIVRDKNINAEQQQRVRGEKTTQIAQEYYYNVLFNADFDVNFIDNEALFLHGAHYLKWVSKLLNFPIDCDNPDIFKFIEEDPNAKYVKYVDEYWLDQEVWNGIQPKATRGIA